MSTIGEILQAALDRTAPDGRAMFNPADHVAKQFVVCFDLWITSEGKPHLSELRITSTPEAP